MCAPDTTAVGRALEGVAIHSLVDPYVCARYYRCRARPRGRRHSQLNRSFCVRPILARHRGRRYSQPSRSFCVRKVLPPSGAPSRASLLTASNSKACCLFTTGPRAQISSGWCSVLGDLQFYLVKSFSAKAYLGALEKYCRLQLQLQVHHHDSTGSLVCQSKY